MKCGWNHNALAQRQADDIHYQAIKEKHGKIDGYSLHFDKPGVVEVHFYLNNKIVETLHMPDACKTFHNEKEPHLAAPDNLIWKKVLQ